MPYSEKISRVHAFGRGQMILRLENGVLMGGTKINLMLNNRDTNKDEIVLTRTLKED